MATNVKSFNIAIRDWTKKRPPAEALKAQKKIALEALRSLVFMTPVDTGRARGNWVVTMNTPSKATPYKGLGRVRQGGDLAGNAAAATSFAMEQVSKINGYTRAGQIIWITNNVAYILKLEGLDPEGEGPTSRQAPLGMLRVTKLRLELMF